ncbi:MAG: hypothetical protein ACI8UP_004385, partial [Porticoccaceae bacterium]
LRLITISEGLSLHWTASLLSLVHAFLIWLCALQFAAITDTAPSLVGC